MMSQVNRATGYLLAQVVFLLATFLLCLQPVTALGQGNPVVIENQQPGTGDWEIQWGSAGTDVGGEIKGYASAASVNKGGSINFHISVKPAQTYTIDVYRIGWYQGLGGRHMQRIGPLNGTLQPTCPTDSVTGLIECQWSVSYTLVTQASWTSGVYVAVLTNAQAFQNYITFVVRDDSRVASLLYQQPVTTYQAYNDYPYDEKTGKSLYSFNSYGANTVSGSKAAVKVSFDRPYNYDGDAGVWGHNVLSVETAFIRWLEKSGYDVTYSTDIDTHANGARLLNYRGIVAPGHDEYWTREMYDSVAAARDAGVNLGFFSANTAYTQIRLEPSSSGVPNRVVVCYRDAALDPNPNPALKTVNWRESPVNRPEQALVGVQYTNQVPQDAQGIHASYVVTNSGHWAYAGSGLSNGNTVRGLVGYEADRLFSEFAQPNAVPGTYTLLSRSPFTASGGQDYGNSSIYQAPSGAWVFSAGTINWGFALDAFNPGGDSLADARIQRVTANVLDRFVGGGQSDFSLSALPATQSLLPGGSASYAITISPSGGFASDVMLSVSGLPSGASASFSPNPAVSTSTLLVTTSASAPGSSTSLTITGVSGSLSHTAGVSLVVNVPDFALSTSPSSRTVTQGGSTTYSLGVNPSGGFTGSVDLSISGLPSGAAATVSPNPTAGTSSIAITTAIDTPPGTYPLTILGTSGALSHTTPATLTVSSTAGSVTVTAPNTATSWKVASTQQINFSHSLGAGQAVNIDVSRDGGSTFSHIATMTTTSATTETYSWIVSGPPTSLARIRVASAVNATVFDVSDVNFTIVNPTVTVSAPNTAVSWRAGDTKNITFSHTLGAGQPVAIDVSRDGGATWSAVATMTTTSTTSGTYAWVVSGPPTKTALVRVVWGIDASVADISDLNFTILPRTTVSAPNTAVGWGAGSMRTVSWSHNLGVGGLVDIDLSLDGGATWSRLATAVPSAAATTGSYSVAMPTTTTTQALIRVSPSGDITLGDVSDVLFTLAAPTITVTAPNTNVAWSIGSTQSIKWSHNLGTLESVKIELARDGVNFTESIISSVSNSAAASGTYSWAVTGPVTSTAKVRVSWPKDSAVGDTSNVTFRIR
jgi:hypothetical protein